MHLMCIKNGKEASVLCRMRDGENKEGGRKESNEESDHTGPCGLFMNLVFSLSEMGSRGLSEIS